MNALKLPKTPLDYSLAEAAKILNSTESALLQYAAFQVPPFDGLRLTVHIVDEVLDDKGEHKGRYSIHCLLDTIEISSIIANGEIEISSVQLLARTTGLIAKTMDDEMLHRLPVDGGGWAYKYHSKNETVVITKNRIVIEDKHLIEFQKRMEGLQAMQDMDSDEECATDNKKSKFLQELIQPHIQKSFSELPPFVAAFVEKRFSGVLIDSQLDELTLEQRLNRDNFRGYSEAALRWNELTPEQRDRTAKAADDSALLQAQYVCQAEEKRKVGRYTLAEAALCIASSAGERKEVIERKLVRAVEVFQLPAYEPGRRAKMEYARPKEGGGFIGSDLRMKFASPSAVRTFYEEVYWDDLNNWLAENEPRILYRFPAPSGTELAKTDSPPSISQHAEFEAWTVALENYFEKPESEIPKKLQEAVKEHFSPFSWDELDSNQRRELVAQRDYRKDPALINDRQREFEYGYLKSRGSKEYRSPNAFGYTILGAAWAISVKYEVSLTAMRNRIFEAVEQGALKVRDPENGIPYIPADRSDCHERVKIADLDKWFEECGVEYRLGDDMATFPALLTNSQDRPVLERAHSNQGIRKVYDACSKDASLELEHELPRWEPKAADWNLWKHFPKAELWKAVALSLNREPESEFLEGVIAATALKTSTANWNEDFGPTCDLLISPQFAGELNSFNSKRIARQLEYETRLAIAEENLGIDLPIFKSNTPDPQKSEVLLSQFAAWAILHWKDLPDELTRLTVPQSATQPVTIECENRAEAPPGLQTQGAKEWTVKAREIADEIGLRRWNSGVREITARNICDAVATELGKTQAYHGNRGPRAAGAVRSVALKGWKFIHPSGTNGMNGTNQ